MVFDNSSDTDARGSTFNDIGRDQNLTIANQVIHINISVGDSRYRLPFSFGNDLLRPPSGPETSHQEGLLDVITSYHSQASLVVNCDTTAQLTVQITHLLIDRRDSANSHQDLILDLKSLHQTLALTGLAIQEYCGKPLGQSLLKAINPEVARCFIVLQELRSRVDGTWRALDSTNISNLWRQIWRSRWDGDEFISLKGKLLESRKLLEGFLMALHSVAWMDVGNELQSSHVSLRRFHDLLKQRLPFLGRIKLNVVNVLSHLGDIIPVPNVFCSTWKDFHYIINGYCKDTFGNRFIGQGDYRIIRAEDNQAIGLLELMNTVESGKIPEMSIVLRKHTAYEKKCPRCSHQNLHAADHNCWIQCRKCPGLFQVATADSSNDSNEDDVNVISPLVGERGGDERLHHENNRIEHSDDDGMQFFRRINILGTRIIDHSPLVHTVYQKKCPRCMHQNLHAAVNNGWIECQGCAAFFQSALPDLSNDSNDDVNVIFPLVGESGGDARPLRENGRLEHGDDDGIDKPISLMPKSARACMHCRAAHKRCQLVGDCWGCKRCSDKGIACIF